MLDAHLSGRAVGKALVESGHDACRPLGLGERAREGMEDPAVLELAFAERRVLVTANVSDFEPLLRKWAEEGRSHAGVVLVPWSVPNEAFGVLIRGIRKTLVNLSQEDWANRVEWLRR